MVETAANFPEYSPCGSFRFSIAYFCSQMDVNYWKVFTRFFRVNFSERCDFLLISLQLVALDMSCTLTSKCSANNQRCGSNGVAAVRYSSAKLYADKEFGFEFPYAANCLQRTVSQIFASRAVRNSGEMYCRKESVDSLFCLRKIPWASIKDE